MANFSIALEASLAHRRGRCQSTTEESSSSNYIAVGPSRDEQDVSFEVHNAPVGTSWPEEPTMGGYVKAHEGKGRAWSQRACEEGSDPVSGI